MTSTRPPHRLLVTPAVLLLLGLVTVGLTAGPAGALQVTWSARAADVPGAADLVGGGRGVTVAVLDSWIDSRHPDFRNHVLEGGTCQRGTCRPGSADQPDGCEAHGTHVAGLIGSSRFGVAPEARILPVRVLTEKSGSCSAEAEDVASGIRFAASHGAQVINISLGSTYALTDRDRIIPRAVADANRQGIVVVVAAGNGKTGGADVYGDDALVVAATAPGGRLASYSQRGAGVDLAAPGGQPKGEGCTPADCVVSTWADRSYAADAGTSMAAPVVAGGAALLLSQKPDRGRDDVVAALLHTAHPLADAGAGVVDVLAAVRGGSAGNGRDADVAPAPAGGGTGPASAIRPSVARLIGPDGRTSTPAPPVARTTLARGQKMPSTEGILQGTAVALVVTVAIALVLVIRTQGLLPGERR